MKCQKSKITSRWVAPISSMSYGKKKESLAAQKLGYGLYTRLDIRPVFRLKFYRVEKSDTKEDNLRRLFDSYRRNGGGDQPGVYGTFLII